MLKLWFQQCQTILQAVEARNYNFESIASSASFFDPDLLTLFVHQVQKGQLQPSAIRSLLMWIRRLEQEDSERRRLGMTAVFRLALASSLALSTSLFLERTWVLDLSRNPPALLVLISHALLCAIWLKRLPGHPLATSLEMRLAWTRVWLGEGTQGPWQEKLDNLMNEAWISGRDPSEERRHLLEDWLLLAQDQQEKRQTWAEELFGLVELASSVYFLGTACTLPLLHQLGG